VKLRVALIALVVALATGVASSQATITSSPLTLSTSSANTFVTSGSTPNLYYSASAGSVTVDVNDTTDTAPLTVDFPDLFGDDPAPGSSTSHVYSWTSGDTDSGTKTVAVTDAGADSKSHDFVVTRDTTGPTGQTVTLSGGPNYATLFVPLVFNTGSDSESGVSSSFDPTVDQVQRASAPLTAGTCGTFGSYAPVALTTNGDLTVVGGNCYRYQYKSADHVGNLAASWSAPTADAKVSTLGPTVVDTAPTEVSGAGDQYWDQASDTIFFRPAATGSFTLNATASDPAGVSNVAFPDVSAVTGWNGSTGGTDSSSPYSSPAVYRWTANATAPGPKQVIATNTGAVTGFDTITIAADSSPPAGQSAIPTGGPWFTSSVALTVSPGTDPVPGSGVDPARSVIERASAPLSNGVCGTYSTFAPVTLTGSGDSSVQSGTCYRYQAKATDNVGNVSATSAPSADAKVDKTVPTTPALIFSGLTNMAVAGSIVYFHPGSSGSFTVSAASADPESGISAYSFPSIPGFAAAGAGPNRTYSATKAGTDPTGQLTVTSTDAAGLTSGVATFSLVPDGSAPTLSIRCDNAPCKSTPYKNTVMVTFRSADTSGSGVGTIRWTTDGSEPRINHGFEYVRGIPVQGLARLRVRAFDRAGNGSPLLGVTVRSLATRLFVATPGSVMVKAKSRTVEARVAATRRSLVTARMSGKSLKKALTWHFVLARGTSVVKLQLPKTIKRGTSYRLVWTITADSRRVLKSTRVTLRK